MNNFNNLTPDATSMAIVGSGHDLGMRRKYGGKELDDSKYLQRNSTTIQESSNSLSKRLQWRPETNNGTDIKYENVSNNNCTGRAVLHIFEELPKEGKKEEENKEKKEEKNKGKKEEKTEGKNEETKGKKKRKKKKKGAKTEEIYMSTPMSTPGPVGKLDEDSGARSQQTSNSSERIVEDHSQKDNSLFRSISHIPRTRRQSLPGQDSTEQRLASFPEKSKTRSMGLRELCGNDSLDSTNKDGAPYSDLYAHNQCAKETNYAALSKLSILPSHICEHLDKNNPFGFHQIANKDSIDFVDEEYIEFLDEKYGITDIKPVFVDHSGLVIWLLDKDGDMYEWNEMEQNLLYMGRNLIDGLTNYFTFPEKICQVMYNGDRIPVMEFNRLIDKKMIRVWNNRKIIN